MILGNDQPLPGVMERIEASPNGVHFPLLNLFMRTTRNRASRYSLPIIDYFGVDQYSWPRNDYGPFFIFSGEVIVLVISLLVPCHGPFDQPPCRDRTNIFRPLLVGFGHYFLLFQDQPAVFLDPQSKPSHNTHTRLPLLVWIGALQGKAAAPLGSNQGFKSTSHHSKLPRRKIIVRVPSGCGSVSQQGTLGGTKRKPRRGPKLRFLTRMFSLRGAPPCRCSALGGGGAVASAGGAEA